MQLVSKEDQLNVGQTKLGSRDDQDAASAELDAGMNQLFLTCWAREIGHNDILELEDMAPLA
jgi:hypothetical protein